MEKKKVVSGQTFCESQIVDKKRHEEIHTLIRVCEFIELIETLKYDDGSESMTIRITI